MSLTTAPRRSERSTLGVVALLVVAVPLVVALGAGDSAYTRIALGVPDRFTTVATTLARGAADLSSAVCVGALVGLLLLAPASHSGTGRDRRVTVGDWTLVRVLRTGAATWTFAALASVVLTAADSNGLSLGRILSGPQALGFSLTSGQSARAWMLTLLAAAGTWLVSRSTTRWTTYAVALVACFVGVLAPVAVGQALVGPNHDIGLDAATLSTVASWTVLGSALALAAREAAGRGTSSTVAAGWRRLAVVLLPAVLLLDLVVLWFEMAGTSPFASTTGLLQLVRIALVAAALGVVATQLSGGTPRRTIAAVAALAGGYLAAGVAMTRVPPPQYFVPTSIAQNLLGYDTPEAPTATRLIFDGRLNLLLAVVSVAAVVGYLLLVRRVRRRGQSWPVLRTATWTVGWVIVLVGTSSGVGRYSGPDFAVHMALHMVLNMLAPVFLVLGGPITLALGAFRARGADEPPGPREKINAVLHSKTLGVLYHPLLVFGLYIGSYYVLYLTDLFGLAMKFHWSHQLMNVHFILVGFLYFGLVIGIDAVPHKLPHLAKFGYILAAMPFHAFFGVIVMSGGSIIGETFYRYLAMPWAGGLSGLAATQKTAGGIAWAGGEIPLLIVVVVLAIQWAQQDSRQARRIDRHLDAGLDDSFAAHNAMFERLAARPGAGRFPEPDEEPRP